MSDLIKSAKTDADLANLQDDIIALKRDVTSLLQHLKGNAIGTAQSAATQIDASAHRIYRNIAAEGGRSAKAIGRQVEDQPLASLLIALGVGYVGGRVLSR